MDKELSKAIMNKSKLRNRYLKWPFRENCLGYKTIENKCNNLLRKLTKKYLQEMLEKVLHQINFFGIQSNLLLAIKGLFVK